MSAYTPPLSTSPTAPALPTESINEISVGETRSPLANFLRSGELKLLLNGGSETTTTDIHEDDTLLTNPITVANDENSNTSETTTTEIIVVNGKNNKIIDKWNEITWQVVTKIAPSKKDAVLLTTKFIALDTNMLIGITFTHTALIFKELVFDKIEKKKKTDWPIKKIALAGSLLLSTKIFNIRDYVSSAESSNVAIKDDAVLILNSQNKAGLSDVLPWVLRNSNNYLGTKLFPLEPDLITLDANTSLNISAALITDTLFQHSSNQQNTKEFVGLMAKNNPALFNATINYFMDTYKFASANKTDNGDMIVKPETLITAGNNGSFQIDAQEFKKIMKSVQNSIALPASKNQQPAEYCFLALYDKDRDVTKTFCENQNAKSVADLKSLIKVYSLVVNSTSNGNTTQVSYKNDANSIIISANEKIVVETGVSTINNMILLGGIPPEDTLLFNDLMNQFGLLNLEEFTERYYKKELQEVNKTGQFGKKTTVSRTEKRGFYTRIQKETTLTENMTAGQLKNEIKTNYDEYVLEQLKKITKHMETFEAVQSIRTKKNEESIWQKLKKYIWKEKKPDEGENDGLLLEDVAVQKIYDKVVDEFNGNETLQIELGSEEKFNTYIKKQISAAIKNGDLEERTELQAKFEVFYTGHLFSYLTLRQLNQRIEENKVQREEQKTIVNQLLRQINSTEINNLIVILHVHRTQPLEQRLKKFERGFIAFNFAKDAIFGNKIDAITNILGQTSNYLLQSSDDTATLYKKSGIIFLNSEVLQLQEEAKNSNSFNNPNNEEKKDDTESSAIMSFLINDGSTVFSILLAIYQVHQKGILNNVLPSITPIIDDTLYIEKSGYKFKHWMEMIGIALSIFSKIFIFPSIASNTITDSSSWLPIVNGLNLVSGKLIPNLCLHLFENVALMNSLCLIEKSMELLNPSYVVRRPIKSGVSSKIRNVLDVFFVLWNRRKDLRNLFRSEDKEHQKAFQYLTCNLQNMSFVESNQMLIEEGCYYYTDKSLGVVVCGLSFFLKSMDFHDFNPTGMFYTAINLLPFVFNKVCKDTRQTEFKLNAYNPIICEKDDYCNTEKMGDFTYWKNHLIHNSAIFDYVKEPGVYTPLPNKNNTNSAAHFILREFDEINDFVSLDFFWKKTDTNTHKYSLVAYISSNECVCYLQNYQLNDSWYSCKPDNVVKKLDIDIDKKTRKIDLRKKDVTQLLYEKVDVKEIDVQVSKSAKTLKTEWTQKIDTIRNCLKNTVPKPGFIVADFKDWDYATHLNRIHFDCPVKAVLSCQLGSEWSKDEIRRMTAEIYEKYKNEHNLRGTYDCKDKAQKMDLNSQDVYLETHPDQYENACLSDDDLKDIIKNMPQYITDTTRHVYKKIEYKVWDKKGESVIQSDDWSTTENDQATNNTEFYIVVLPRDFFNKESVLHFLPFKCESKK